MNAEGQRISQVTHTKVGPLALGLLPTAWSENGDRLLTEFGGEDQNYAVAVSPVTGVGKEADRGTPRRASRAPRCRRTARPSLGTVGLGFGGSPQPEGRHRPLAAAAEVLVKGGSRPPGAATRPSWWRLSRGARTPAL